MSRPARLLRRAALAVRRLALPTGALLIALWIPAGGAEHRSDPLVFTITTAVRHPISRFIYGMNFAEQGGSPRGTAPWFGATLPPEITFSRFGGNRLSAFNWQTGYSNVGRDGNGTWGNDAYLVSSGNGAWRYGADVGGAVAGRIEAAERRHQAIMVTVPMLSHVAGDLASRLDTTSADRSARLAAHFKRNVPVKGRAFSLTPSETNDAVYQDEFANFVNVRFPNRARDPVSPIFFGLDNEPDSWVDTHAEIVNGLWSYATFADTSILFARAIKSVIPAARVFGPSVATYTGVVAGDRYRHGWVNDPQFGRQNFFDVYLDRMREAERSGGVRLLDVLDLHFYPSGGTRGGEIGNDYATQDAGMIDARLQAPRSLWDPSYVEWSWVTSVTGGAIELLPRLRGQIARHYPGTQLAVTEYYYGRGGDISGGLAQADVLGVFGREGVFAAALWPNAGVWAKPYGGDGSRAYAFVFAAFRLFLDYDGAGARFGDTGVRALSSDNAKASVYASVDDRGRVTIIAINKDQTAASRTSIRIVQPRALTRVTGVHQLTAASPSIVRVGSGSVAVGGYRDGVNSFTYDMPPLSASVIVLEP